MNKIYKTLIVLLLLTSCGNSHLQTKRPEFTGDIKTDINNLLPDGNVTADIMDGIKENPRQTELYNKFEQGVRQNQKWFMEYMKYPIPATSFL